MKNKDGHHDNERTFKNSDGRSISFGKSTPREQIIAKLSSMGSNWKEIKNLH